MPRRIYTIEDREVVLQEQVAEKKRMTITFWSEYKKAALQFPSWLLAFAPPIVAAFAYVTHNPELGVPAVLAIFIPGIPAHIGIILEAKDQVNKKRAEI